MLKLALAAILPCAFLLSGFANAATVLNGPWAGGTVAASTHVIVADGASLMGDVTVGGTLQFMQTGALTVTTKISGTGALLFSQPDILTLTGTSTVDYTPSIILSTESKVLSGTLNIGQSGTCGLVVGDYLFGTGTASLGRTTRLLCDGGHIVNGQAVVGVGRWLYDDDWQFVGTTGPCSVEMLSGTWECSDLLKVGSWSAQGAVAMAGGSIFTKGVTVGVNGQNGSAIIRSGTWINKGEFFVMGNANYVYNPGSYSPTVVDGTSTLDLGGGTLLSDTAVFEGPWRPGCIARALISGGTLAITSGLSINQGSNLQLKDGVVRSASAQIGFGSNAYQYGGQALVTGGTWDTAARLTIGYLYSDPYAGTLGPAVLSIDGGVVVASSSDIGGNRGNGLVALSSGTLATRSALIVGNGTLKVLGGTATSDKTYIGRNLDGDGRAQIHGGLLASKDAFIGYEGLGSLDITGGYMTSRNCFVGYLADGRGTATMSGGTWATSGSLYVGVASLETATVTVRGGSMMASTASVGFNAGSRGSLVLNGGTFSAGSVFVGLNGDGALAVNGGIATGTASFIGYGAGSTGVVEVSSGTWSSKAHLHVGFDGTGSLNLRGGSVVSTNGYIGYGYAGRGSVSVSSGTWSTTNLVVGGSGIATLDITDSGVVDVSSSLSVGNFGSIAVRPGGTLRFEVLPASISSMPTSITNDGSIIAGSASDFGTLPALSGHGILRKRGDGRLTIPKADSFRGTVEVETGSLFLGEGYETVGPVIHIGLADIAPSAHLMLGNETIVDHLTLRAGASLEISTFMPVTVMGGLTRTSLRDALASTGRGISSLLNYPTGWLDNGDGSFTLACALPGDTNLDGAIDILDIGDFISAGQFNSENAVSWSGGDFNHDGLVDIIDVSLLVSNGWFNRGPYIQGRSVSLNVVAVPEPSMLPALPLAAATVLAIGLRRRW
jgi:fibronectin-binding autotransporter adhesin